MVGGLDEMAWMRWHEDLWGLCQTLGSLGTLSALRL